MITRCCDLRQPMSCLCCYILREAPIMHIASFSGPTGSNKAFVSFIHIVQCISQNYYVYHNTYANYILKETRWNSKNGFLCSFTTKDMKCTWQIQWKLKNQIGCNEKSFFSNLHFQYLLKFSEHRCLHITESSSINIACPRFRCWSCECWWPNQFFDGSNH